VHAKDEDQSGPGEWLVRHGAEGVTVRREHAKADVAVTGTADRLLLLLMRRRPADDPSITVYGDRGLLVGWLAGTQF
jgi:predicted lipid carrier protein YhbT